ncbi:hypothetical protein B0H14DRAFT_2590446 [Mycena olivaceomarginata]|nr:hypothetical protein B0H14DRAFT_2590446 [Mycena olivaceomarginata]
MSLQNYHKICCWHLFCWRNWSISTNTSVKLGSIRHFSGPEYENSLEVAYWDCRILDHSWSMKDPIIEDYWHPINCDQEGTSMLVNGWIRINSADVVDEYRHRISTFDGSHGLAHANDIFNRLDITWGFEDFVLVDDIEYCLALTGPTDDLSPGYLFLLIDLEAEVPNSFQIPDRIAYWSLDPSGADLLSEAAAQYLGFPAIQLQILVCGKSWDASVYNGICQFHESKGFDPRSQEVALELGYPPFQVSCDWEALLAHLQQSDAGDCYSNSDGVSCTEYFSESYQESDVGDCCPNSAGVSDSCTVDFFESWDEQSDSPGSIIGDTFPVQEEIDLALCNPMEDHTSWHEDSLPAIEDPSEAPKHPRRVAIDVALFDKVEMVAPSRSLNVIICVQLILILAATALSLVTSTNIINEQRSAWVVDKREKSWFGSIQGHA